MTEEAKKLLATIEKVTWFCNVGQSLENVNARQVHSWREAFKLCRSRLSQNVQLESGNILSEKLCYRFLERYRSWNELVGKISRSTDPLVLWKILSAPDLPKFSEGVLNAIRSDLRMALMELEYADLIAPRFFAERAKWYLAGHFPCGWDGDFPEGQLIVY